MTESRVILVNCGCDDFDHAASAGVQLDVSARTTKDCERQT